MGAGEWYVLAVADDAEEVAETFETNNDRALLLHFGPDLDVTSLSAPSSAIAGTAISISSTVKNLGAETAPASTTRFYLSTNTAFDESDTLIGEQAVPALTMNASHASSTVVTVPSGMTGKRYIIAVADGVGAIVESSESNNAQARVITVNP
jgi:subtilase family serine protease